MSENSTVKPNICACSNESVALELFKDIKLHHSQEDLQRIYKLDPKKQMAYYLQIYSACLKAAYGIKIDLITESLPDINSILSK